MLRLLNFVTTLTAAILLVLTAQIAAAQVTITGTVTEADTQEPMVGVSVAVPGTTMGTTTNVDGMYSLEVPSSDGVLVFSFVGFRLVEIALTSGVTVIDVELEPSILGLDEVVVVGTRRTPRLATDSAVPVDVLGPADLETAASTDIDDVLRNVLPSYNVQRHGIDDEATLVRPVTLRGLPADNVIVLVNGRRRHRSASIALLGSSLNTGAQGPDLNMIPSIALKQVEVLRDGASAQYGSDAVAGVFNMQLRDNSSGVLVRMQSGQYGDGDGEYAHVAANVGLPLTERGFINASIEYRNAAPTIRAGQRADATVLAARGYPVNNPSQIWGSPDVDDQVVSFINAGIDLSTSVRAYAHGGYGVRTSEGGFYFRSPGTSSARGGVFRVGDRRAIADLNDNDDVMCSSLEDLPPLDADLSTVNAFISNYRGQCFLFNEMFQGGFTPRFGADISDVSGVVGIEGELGMGLLWDLSFGGGQSVAEYFIYNTINASYGPDTPTSFRPRDYIQEEYSVNANFVLPVAIEAFASPLNVAWGLEWRNEIFESKPGDFDSYNPGPYIKDGFSVGSNGYQGLHPKFAGRWTRPNVAVYGDLEADITESLLVGVAARYEDFYEDFGSTIKGKVAAMWRLSDGLAARATYSTGFRAPSPGQANLQALQTALSASGDFLVETGQLPPTHPISAGLGATPLTEETSRSYSVGVVIELGDEVDLTIDYFNIALEDRISLTGNIGITDELSRIMDEADILGGVKNLAEVKFFSNDFDTSTKGVDLLLSWDREWDRGRATIMSLAFSRLSQELTGFSESQNITTFLGETLTTPVSFSILTPRRQIELEQLSPKHRAVFNWRQIRGRAFGVFRLSYYSGWEACRLNNNACPSDVLDEYDGAMIADLELGMGFQQNSYRVAVGINNLLDTTHVAHQQETDSQGNNRVESQPWDYNGRAFYARITANVF